jgi:tRNA pseudouridine55 synthase
VNHGFLILDKPLGISSAKAVSEVKRLLKCKKIGHGGTLDPLASGVLPLAIGEATKAFDYVVSTTKQYRFTITFGEERTTDDAEGQVTATTDVRPTREMLLAALPAFTGSILQTPPAFSALKINGERAYKLARAGQQVEMTPRTVEVYSLTLDSILAGDAGNAQEATLTVTCGKGTYVRSLARDIARKVNSLGYVSMLRRTAVGKFNEQQAISLEKCAEIVHSGALFEAWVTLELALDDIPAIEVDTQQALKIRQGQAIAVQTEDGKYLALHLRHALALCNVENGLLRPMRVFNLN